MDKSKLTTIFGFGAMILGFVATAIGNWASDQKMKQLVHDEVLDQLENRDDEDAEDEYEIEEES